VTRGTGGVARRVLGGALALFGALVPASVSAQAGTGWQVDYDYPGQGADWYGTRRYDIDRDFGPPPAAIATNGDDFGLGYDALFDRLGHGPPAARTNGSGSEYIFRFGSRLSEGGLCFVDVDCSDGVFCNGAELCRAPGGACAPGPLPDCDDREPCTIDSCDTGRDACVATPRDRAPEVAGLTVTLRDPRSPEATVRWEKGGVAEYFNLYRATELPPFDRFFCLRDRITELEAVDDGAIPESGLFEYLVTAYACGGESTLGTTSEGKERRGSACP
jgi:hypothetical protein